MSERVTQDGAKRGKVWLVTSLNSGPTWRRCAQALGLIYNDDSTWTLLHLSIPRPPDGSMRWGFREPPRAREPNPSGDDD